MGHFAKVVDGLVTQVIVAEKEFFDTFVDSSPGQWLRTSYNTRGGKYYLPDSNDLAPDQSMALRKNYAGIGYSYDAQRDAFIPPKPPVDIMPNAELDEESCIWVDRTTPVVTIPPMPIPELMPNPVFDEATNTWVDRTTPVETLP
jgi:hypothetical protein